MPGLRMEMSCRNKVQSFTHHLSACRCKFPQCWVIMSDTGTRRLMYSVHGALLRARSALPPAADPRAIVSWEHGGLPEPKHPPTARRSGHAIGSFQQQPAADWLLGMSAQSPRPVRESERWCVKLAEKKCDIPASCKT